jgi:hypothetical protein
MDMQPLQARFATQDQAESAMRKLTALRSDCFRLERTATYDDVGAEAIVDLAQSMDGLTASVLAGSGIQSFSGSGGEYTLSANVPGAVTEQARTDILQVGGQVL